MIDILSDFVQAHAKELIFSLVLAIGLNISINDEPIAKSIIRLVTGFHYGFFRSLLTTFICGTFVTLYFFKGVIAATFFLILLRVLWLIDFSFWTLDFSE